MPEIFIWKVRYYEILFISWRKLAAGQINISPRVNIVTHKASHLTEYLSINSAFKMELYSLNYANAKAN